MNNKMSFKKNGASNQMETKEPKPRSPSEEKRAHQYILTETSYRSDTMQPVLKQTSDVENTYGRSSENN